MKRIAGVTLFVVLALAMAIGCSSTGDGSTAKPRGEVTESTQAPLINGIPDCNKQGAPWSTFQAIPHADGTYWGRTPWANDSPTYNVRNYEQEIWNNVWQSNGYLYLVKLVATSTGSKKVGQMFFGVGVEAQGASPAWYWTPPSTPPLPTHDGTYYGPTAHDYSAEISDISSSPGNITYPNPDPVDADAWACVTILDKNGVVIDYFVMMDTHDPTGPPW